MVPVSPCYLLLLPSLSGYCSHARDSSLPISTNYHQHLTIRWQKMQSKLSDGLLSSIYSLDTGCFPTNRSSRMSTHSSPPPPPTCTPTTPSQTSASTKPPPSWWLAWPSSSSSSCRHSSRRLWRSGDSLSEDLRLMLMRTYLSSLLLSNYNKLTGLLKRMRTWRKSMELRSFLNKYQIFWTKLLSLKNQSKEFLTTLFWPILLTAETSNTYLVM